MKKNKFGKGATLLCLVLAAVFAIGFSAGCGAGGTEYRDVEVQLPETPAVKPTPHDAVRQVTVTFNGEDAAVIETDIAAGSVTVEANVICDDGADGSVTWTSDNESVATVDGGKITLVSVGSAAITAAAGDKSDSVVVQISDGGAAASYTITVSGGSASVNGSAAASAKAGDYVLLTPTIEDGKDFDKWVLTSGGQTRELYSHGFIMPAADVQLTLSVKAAAHRLNIAGGALIRGGEEVEGADGGYDADGNAVTAYTVESGSSVTVRADEAESGYMFVGWDENFRDQRTGGAGASEYTFVMPDEDVSLFPVYSEISGPMLNSGIGVAQESWGAGFREFGGEGWGEIVSGTVPGASAPDPDLEGLSGYRLAIPADSAAHEGYRENIADMCKLVTTDGARTVKVIFVNRGAYALSLEFGASYNGNVASTGTVEVPAYGKATAFFTVNIGVGSQWGGPYTFINLRRAVGGSAGQTVLLDMVTAMAPTYPDGDPFINNPDAKSVEIGSDVIKNNSSSVTASIGAGNKYFVLFYMQSQRTPPASVVFRVTNMPAYDTIEPDADGKRYTTIYVQIRDNMSDAHSNTLEFGFGKDIDPLAAGSTTQLKSFTLSKKDDVVLLAFRIERTADDADDAFYLSVVDKGQVNSNWSNYTVAFYYNNVIGYGGEV